MSAQEVSQTLRLPQEPSNEELARDWTLSQQDQEEILKCRGDLNRLRFAIQLCSLRRYGQFLHSYLHAPTAILNHLAHQIGASPLFSLPNNDRPATESSHHQRLKSYLDYSSFGQEERQRLERWLAEQANSCFSVSELLELAYSTLFQWKVIPPKSSTLTRLVASVNTRNQEHWLEQIASSLDPELLNAFDKLLLVPEERRTSSLYHLKQHPPEGRPKAILEQLDRFKELQKLGVTELRLTGFDEVIVQQLAEYAARYGAKDLKRFRRSKRYAMLACFLVEMVKTVLDHSVLMHDQCVTTVVRRSRNAFQKRKEEERRKAKQGFNTLLDKMEGFLSQNSEESALIELFGRTDWAELEQGYFCLFPRKGVFQIFRFANFHR